MSFQRITGLSLALCAALGLAGCIETTQTGLPSGARAKFGRIAVVPGVSDRVLSSYWAGAFSEPVPVEGRLGWDASSGTARLVRQQLEAIGARVTVAPSQTSRQAKTSEAVIVLQQAPLNKLGQNYDPGRDFFAMGGGLIAIAAVAGARENKSKLFQPRFVLWVRNPRASKAMIGENACTVGLSASLVDPASGKAISSGTQVLGRTIIPGDLTAQSYSKMPKAERTRVLAACQSALRSAVSQALVKLNLTR